MAKKKYYAVKIGRKPGIYETWPECELQIKGISGASYKAFNTIEEAEKFITTDLDYTQQSISSDDVNTQIEQTLLKLKKDEVVAFVDGSYNSKEEKAGFGVIIIDYKYTQTSLYKAFTKKLSPDFIELRNVAAELEGVKEAINWAINYKKTKIIIYYDYEGIEKWANRSWKAKKTLTRQYVNFLEISKRYINIEFQKVPAHSGIKYNEAADALARKSLLEKGYKTYNDGSVYVLGISISQWKEIVDSLNRENEQLIEKQKTIEKQKLVLNITDKSRNRQRITISNIYHKVTITLYNNNRSYIQGKSSPLFQRILSQVLEKHTGEQELIEVLNHIHVLTITQEEVEIMFEKFLPNYNEQRSGKHYNNLLSAVYNTMLRGYMPDYTCLITPIFRAYEYYLHRILGDYMELTTSNKNDTNNFSYFKKDDQGKYYCTAKQTANLNQQQVDFLNKLYNEYHNIRHPYSHWSANDYNTAVIEDIEPAQEYIKEGLKLINEFYKLF